MRNCINNTACKQTGSREFGYYTRTPAQEVQLPVLVNSQGKPITPGSRIYMPENPVINSQMTIGILGFTSNGGSISNAIAKPVGLNVNAVGLAEFLLITLCDKNGTELIKRMPYNELCFRQRKFLPVFAHIATHRSYFSVTNGAPAITLNAVANLVYFLRPLK